VGKSTEKQTKRSRLLRALDIVERVGNALPHPAAIFCILAVLVVVASVWR
jgi:aminobenzoyl-glutamate transport protein